MRKSIALAVVAFLAGGALPALQRCEKRHRRARADDEGRRDAVASFRRALNAASGSRPAQRGRAFALVRRRSATRRAISAGASSGIGNTELTLISPST